MCAWTSDQCIIMEKAQGIFIGCMRQLANDSTFPKPPEYVARRGCMMLCFKRNKVITMFLVEQDGGGREQALCVACGRGRY